jgi:hypothetical protein
LQAVVAVALKLVAGAVLAVIEQHLDFRLLAVLRTP